MLKTKNLGLAAYIKMCGVYLDSMDGKYFVFDTAITEQEYLVNYMNTDCHKHDVTLCELRRLLING